MSSNSKIFFFLNRDKHQIKSRQKLTVDMAGSDMTVECFNGLTAAAA